MCEEALKKLNWWDTTRRVARTLYHHVAPRDFPYTKNYLHKTCPQRVLIWRNDVESNSVWNDEMMFSKGKRNHTKYFRAPGKATYLELWNLFSGSLTHCQLTNITGKQHLQQQQQHQQSEQNTTKIIGLPVSGMESKIARNFWARLERYFLSFSCLQTEKKKANSNATDENLNVTQIIPQEINTPTNKEDK